MGRLSSKHNFNLYALNTILGLQKGAIDLQPYSVEFQKFSYKCFSIERDHSISKYGKVKPEVCLTSEKIKNSLLFEFSIGDVSFKSTSKGSGSSQLDRYNSIEKLKLINIAAFPKNSVDSYDVVFIVPNPVLQGYIDEFKAKGLNFPILELEYLDAQKKYSLEKKYNTFSVSEVDDFFSNRMLFQRIPKYIQLDLSNLNNSKLKFLELAAINLLVQLYKSKQDDIFNNVDIAKRIIKPNVWKLLSGENKTNAQRLTGSFIEQLIQKYPEIQHRYFTKEKKHFHYKVILKDINKESVLSKIHKRIIQFAKEEADPNFNPQLSLGF